MKKPKMLEIERGKLWKTDSGKGCGPSCKTDCVMTMEGNQQRSVVRMVRKSAAEMF
jgi:hypothetical protein